MARFAMGLGHLSPDAGEMRRHCRFVETRARSVAYFERRRVFRLHFAPIVNAGSGNIGVSEPFLDLGYVGVVVEGVGGGSGPQCVGADFETQRQRIAADEFIDAIRGDGVVELAGAVVADGPEQRTWKSNIANTQQRR